MSDAGRGRRVRVIVEYDGKDISDEIAAGLDKLTVTRNTDEADDLQITLEDREGSWRGPWFPKVASQSQR